MKGLTQRQHQVLQFIADYQKQNSFPPTLQEIAAEFGFTFQSGSVRHISALEHKGYLLRDGAKGRSLALTPMGREALGALLYFRYDPDRKEMVPL